MKACSPGKTEPGLVSTYGHTPYGPQTARQAEDHSSASPHPGLQAFTRIRFEFRVSRFAFGEIVYYCSDSKLETRNSKPETRNAKRHLKI